MFVVRLYKPSLAFLIVSALTSIGPGINAAYAKGPKSLSLPSQASEKAVAATSKHNSVVEEPVIVIEPEVIIEPEVVIEPEITSSPIVSSDVPVNNIIISNPVSSNNNMIRLKLDADMVNKLQEAFDSGDVKVIEEARKKGLNIPGGLIEITAMLPEKELSELISEASDSDSSTGIVDLFDDGMLYSVVKLDPVKSEGDDNRQQFPIHVDNIATGTRRGEDGSIEFGT